MCVLNPQVSIRIGYRVRLLSRSLKNCLELLSLSLKCYPRIKGKATYPWSAQRTFPSDAQTGIHDVHVGIYDVDAVFIDECRIGAFPLYAGGQYLTSSEPKISQGIDDLRL